MVAAVASWVVVCAVLARGFGFDSGPWWYGGWAALPACFAAGYGWDRFQRRRGRELSTASVVLLVVLAWYTPTGVADSPRPPSTASSTPTRQTPTPAPTPTDGLPPDPLGGDLLVPPFAPVGRRLTAAEGVGAGTVQLVRPPHVGSFLTVRFACVGPGRVRILDHTGHVEFTGGCARGAIYGGGWRTTRRDGRTIRIAVAPTVHWAVDVWLAAHPPADH